MLTDSRGDFSAAEHERLQRLAPRLTSLCAELEAGLVPTAGLDHGDLHDGNIFVQPGGGRYVFFDWGDCTITHPFFGLRTALISIENTLGLDEESPQLARLRDAYLEPWTAGGVRRNDLRAHLALALRVAPVSRALTWHQAVARLPAPLRKEYAHAVPALLHEFLETEQTAIS